MSDLDDLDTGPDALAEEEVSAHADPLIGENAKKAPAAVDKSVLVKAAAGLAVVVVAGGAYFMMSSSHPAAPKSSFPSPAAQRAAASHAALSTTLSSATGSAAGGSKTPDLLPAAIPPLEAGATPSGMTAPPSPPIVNEMPPSSEQLSSVGTPKPPSAAPSMPAAPPTSIDAQIPGYPAPSAAPSITAPVVPASAATASAPGIPAIPEQVPAPFKTDTSAANSNAMAPAQPAIQPISPPIVKSEMPMPTVPVASVAETDINKTQADQNSPNQNTVAIPAPGNVNVNNADSAKVEELQQKIADLEKTIAQLQEAAVTKEDATAKSAEETAAGATPVAAPKAHHTAKRTASSRRMASAHGSSAHWVLRAAKPGVAWVAKKGSDDLQMVNVGDTLRGVGTVTSISQDASGDWVISGSQGRISQ
jgi:hypothetical protein